MACFATAETRSTSVWCWALPGSRYSWEVSLPGSRSRSSQSPVLRDRIVCHGRLARPCPGLPVAHRKQRFTNTLARASPAWDPLAAGTTSPHPAVITGGTETGRAEYHRHHHDLIAHRHERIHTGKNLARHHARQGHQADGEQRIDQRDQRGPQRDLSRFVVRRAATRLRFVPLGREAQCVHRHGEDHARQRDHDARLVPQVEVQYARRDDRQYRKARGTDRNERFEVGSYPLFMNTQEHGTEPGGKIKFPISNSLWCRFSPRSKRFGLGFSAGAVTLVAWRPGSEARQGSNGDYEFGKYKCKG